MKKLLYTILFCLLFLTGCEKNQISEISVDFFELTSGVTSKGIQTGDKPKEFQDAYKNYPIQVAFLSPDSNYQIMSIDKIPYEEEICTMISSFFVNGKPTTDEELCKKNQVAPSDLYRFLSSPDYLRKHEVIYRYLNFDWMDGQISDIDAGELNYNETFEVPYQE